MKEKLYKCLKEGRVSPYANFQWPYRKWIKARGELVECKNGIHLCREKDLIPWLNEQIWEVEAMGERVDCRQKIIVREARLVKKLHTWNEGTARLFMCDCAERVLPIYEELYPDDRRLRKTVETARKYAIGKASKTELETARDIAMRVTWAVICTTTKTARVAAGKTARAVAGKAARAAGEVAAKVAEIEGIRTAARSVAKEAERKWQTEKLMAYLYPLKSDEKKLDKK